MIDEHDTGELASHERDLFNALPRESSPHTAATERLVAALKREGWFRSTRSRPHWALQAAAAVLLLAAGVFAGTRVAARNSLERELARTDLSVADRILLLQRAGSAYVTAAHAYASATAHADSTAVEVANQVLRGAAQAVMKSSLSSPLSTNLVAALNTPVGSATKPILWY